MESNKKVTPKTIKQNWAGPDRGDTNPCVECPRRDEASKAHPYFAVAGSQLEYTNDGLESTDVTIDELPETTNVMILGEAPGGKTTYNGEKRTAKNTPDSVDISAGAPDYPLPMYQDGKATGNVADWEEFAAQLARHWPTEQHGKFGIYYTNHTKCSDILFEDRDGRLVERGGDHCSQYLLPEINYVDPDAILVFSGNRPGHLRTALSDLGIRMSSSGSIGDAVFNEQKENTGDPEDHPFNVYRSDTLPDTPIFASYHWQRGMSTVGRQVDDSAYPQQYLTEDLTRTKEKYAAGLAGAVIEELP